MGPETLHLTTGTSDPTPITTTTLPATSTSTIVEGQFAEAAAGAVTGVPYNTATGSATLVDNIAPLPTIKASPGCKASGTTS